MTRPKPTHPDPLEGRRAASAHRNAINRHNGLLGNAYWARISARTVLNAATTTEAAKEIAVRLEAEADALIEALRVRNPKWEECSLAELAEERVERRKKKL